MQTFPLSASPLRLEHYYIQALRFETKDNFDHEEVAVSPTPDELQWNLEHQTAENEMLAFRLTLQLPPDNARFAYAFEIVVTGFFQVDESFEGDIPRMADANAPAVLFGVAREAIAAATARGPFPALCLPTVHFLGIERAPQKKSAAKKSTANPKSPATKRRALPS